MDETMRQRIQVNRRHFAFAAALAPLIPVVSRLMPLAEQQTFPAEALIRGENVRVRAQPTNDAANNAILQRGDLVILTGPIETHPDGQFYPVQVPGSGVTGWVLWLFINPTSITPVSGVAVTSLPTQVVIEQPTVVEVVAPTPTPTKKAGGNQKQQGGTKQQGGNQKQQGGNQQQSGNQKQGGNRQQNAQETPTPRSPEPTPTPQNVEATPSAQRVMVSGSGASTTDPFNLVAGKYKVSASMKTTGPSGFKAVLHGPNQFSNTLFDQNIDTAQNWTASTDLTLDQGGQFTVDVTKADAAWRIRFVPA
jgi:hypothetical protein